MNWLGKVSLVLFISSVMDHYLVNCIIGRGLGHYELIFIRKLFIVNIDESLVIFFCQRRDFESIMWKSCIILGIPFVLTHWLLVRSYELVSIVSGNSCTNDDVISYILRKQVWTEWNFNMSGIWVIRIIVNAKHQYWLNLNKVLRQSHGTVQRKWTRYQSL